MRTFQKSDKLDSVRYAVRGDVLEEADRLALEGKKYSGLTSAILRLSAFVHRII